MRQSECNHIFFYSVVYINATTQKLDNRHTIPFIFIARETSYGCFCIYQNTKVGQSECNIIYRVVQKSPITTYFFQGEGVLPRKSRFSKSLDLGWNFFDQLRFWKSNNSKCLFADFEKWPIFKKMPFCKKISNRRNYVKVQNFDMLCFGKF